MQVARPTKRRPGDRSAVALVLGSVLLVLIAGGALVARDGQAALVLAISALAVWALALGRAQPPGPTA